VLDEILNKAEGNPFFLEEVVWSLIEQRAAVWTASTGRWTIVAAVEDITLPDTVHQLITSRLDRLPEDALLVLRVAAVAGRTFKQGVLNSLLGRQVVDTCIAELVHHDLIRSLSGGDEPEYSFKHALIHDVTYRNMLAIQRRELHLRLASCIETQYVGHPEQVFGVLAYHYAGGGDTRRAVEFLHKAGDQARVVAADGDTLDYYANALRLLHALRPDPLQYAILECKLGEAYYRVGDSLLARRHLESAVAQLHEPIPQRGVRTWVAAARMLSAEAVRTFVPRRKAEAQAVDVPDVADQAISAYRALCWMDLWTSRERFLIDLLQSVRAARKWGDGRAEAEALAGLGVVLTTLGVYGQARVFLGRALDMANELNDPGTLGVAFGALGHHEQTVGNLALAGERFRQAIANFSRAGNIHNWGSVAWGLASVWNWNGIFEASYGLGLDIARLGSEAGDRQLSGWGLLACGWSTLNAGDLRSARQHLESARQDLEAVRDHLSACHLLALLAEVDTRSADLSAADATLRECERLITEHGLRGLNADSIHIARAELWLARARENSGTAREHAIDKTIRACKQVGIRLNLPSAYRLLGCCEQLRGRLSRARDNWQRSLSLATQLELYNDVHLTRAEWERTFPDDAAIERFLPSTAHVQDRVAEGLIQLNNLPVV
jgi:tetratricopeptide (TPR) repeat protein